jgi:hypothetical protein
LKKAWEEERKEGMKAGRDEGREGLGKINKIIDGPCFHFYSRSNNK